MTDELIAGNLRTLQRSVDELAARVAVHESAHAGVSLPDVVSWGQAQWLRLNPGAKYMIVVYGLMLLIALAKWCWRQIKGERRLGATGWRVVG